MSLIEVADILACPHCHGPLGLQDGTLRCEAGHSFDVAKQGHVNLLGAAQPKNADTPAMVQARADFLERGFYSPMTDALTAAVAGAGTLLDAGCGTGHHLAGMMRSADRAVGMDVSVAAARRAAKIHPRVGVVVADTWRRLPLLDQAVDVVTAIFAPRNLPEFARVLHPGGRLVVAAPEPEHLAEARAAFGLLDVQPGKHDALLADTAELFAPVDSVVVRHRLELDADAAALLVAMGPNAFHEHAAPGAITTTFAVRVSTFALR